MAFSTITNEPLLSKAIVVDNSVMMRWLFNDGSEKDKHYAQSILNSISSNKLQVIVPYIWVYEASIVVNFYKKKGDISVTTAKKHLKSLFDLCHVIRGEETPEVLFDFSNNHALTSYDSSYVMLALHYNIEIATLDKEIIRESKNLNISLMHE